MPHFVGTVSSPLPRAEVFDYMADFANARAWDPTVVEAVALDAGGPRLGARYRIVVKALGRETAYEYETIEYEPPSRVVLRAETGAVVSLDTITFSETSSGTDFTYDAKLELKAVLRVFELPMRLGFARLAGNAKAGLERELGAGSTRARRRAS